MSIMLSVCGSGKKVINSTYMYVQKAKKLKTGVFNF